MSDGSFDPNAHTAQLGAAVILKVMLNTGQIPAFPPRQVADDLAGPLVPRYSTAGSQDAAVRAKAVALQRWLSTYLAVPLVADGVPGPATSDAYHRVTGHYLPGDPRA